MRAMRFQDLGCLFECMSACRRSWLMRAADGVGVTCVLGEEASQITAEFSTAAYKKLMLGAEALALYLQCISESKAYAVWSWQHLNNEALAGA